MRYKLKQYREKAGFSQANFATMLGISKPYYNQIENGKRGLSLTLAERIALILGNKLGWPESAPWIEEIFLTSKSAKRKDAV